MAGMEMIGAGSLGVPPGSRSTKHGPGGRCRPGGNGVPISVHWRARLLANEAVLQVQTVPYDLVVIGAGGAGE